MTMMGEQIGDATLYLGDCLEVLRQLPDGSVDAVVTDPPYGTTERGKDKLMGIAAGQWTAFGESWDEERPLAWLTEAERVLKPGGALVVFTDTKRTESLWVACESAGVRPLQLFFWHKTNPAPNPRKNFASAVEAAVFARKAGGVRHWSGGGFTHNVYACPKVHASHKQHPTQKPLNLMAWLVRLVCPFDGLLLDCFAGSGTTGVACQQEGRRCILIERDAGYYQTMRNRIQQAHAALATEAA